MPTQKKFDIIIAGAGAAGLTLAHELLRSTLSQKNILIIDKDDKSKNDRTWCFWTNKKTAFDSIVFRKWDKVVFKNRHQEKVINISPFQYQMIRGIDFYSYVKDKISKHSNVKWIKDEIVEINETDNYITATTTSGQVSGDILFDSLPPTIPESIPKKNNYLVQHFKGYVVQTKEKRFDAKAPYLMDFSVDQHHQTRFGYVLPFSENEALIEFTIFSEKLLDPVQYDRLLKDYVETSLGISNYTIAHEEFGIIPMTDIHFPRRTGKRIYHIGARGGMTKASTGYTFKNILHECASIVKNMENGVLNALPRSRKFSFFDSVLLHVLAKDMYPADRIFSALFLKNKSQLIFDFLDEKTTLMEDIRIISSFPFLPFIKGAWCSLIPSGQKKVSISP